MQTERSTNEIAVVGELNVDLLASGLVCEPALGQEIIAGDFEITLGSASAIFACGAARLGRDVTFISCVGDDEFGEFCIAALTKRGISVDNVERRKDAKTGVTIVLSTPKERAMVTYLGAIAEFGFEDLPLDALDGHRHLHLTSYFLQTKLRPNFVRLMTEAKKKGLTISFDPNSDPTQEWRDEIYNVIRLADILFLNETEAKQLTSSDELQSAVIELGRFSPCPVIKLGPNGAVAYRDGKIISADGFAVATVDTTGAGDSFAAGFVHAFLDGRDVRDCLTMGNACGALSTTGVGGTNAQPDAKQADDLLTTSLVSSASRNAFVQ